MFTNVVWLFLVVAFLCWGSFLNACAYRLTHQKSIFLPRSFCPSCKHILSWIDLIPVVSWIVLLAKCRYCKHPISPLYPLIEVITAILLSALILTIDPHYWISYFIFLSALIIVIRTDLEMMLIPRIATVAIIPIAWMYAAIGSLPIDSASSIGGTIFGYLFLWTIGRLFFVLRGKEGIGEGDFDLLAMIGSFTGIAGAWFSVFIGATIGSIIGLYIIYKQNNSQPVILPFGPWLALGAICYIFLWPLSHDYLGLQSIL